MDTLRSLAAFVHSVELGSLSGAARALDTTQPTVSKLVAALERSVGVRLLRRSATGLSLTEEGLRFHERAKRMLEDYGDAVADARAQVQQPRGLLRVSAPVALGELRLNAMALEFLALYPDIELELLLEDRFVDPLEERIDVSLRLGGRLPPDLVARPVATWPRTAGRASRRTWRSTSTCAMRAAMARCCSRGRRGPSACRCAAATA